MHWVSRSLPPGVRHARGRALESPRRARRADVVYTTGMLGRSLARRAARAHAVRDQAHRRPGLRARAPLGARERRSSSEFQRGGGGALAALAARAPATSSVRRAAHVVCPSAYLRELVVALGRARRTRDRVLPNPAPRVAELPPRDDRASSARGPTLVFAGRLTAQKSLDVALAALRRSAGVDAR